MTVPSGHFDTENIVKLELQWAITPQLLVARIEISTWRSESISLEPVYTVNTKNCFWYLQIAFLVT